MDKASIICELHEIADHYWFGRGTWPIPRENLPALFKTFRSLGLDEDVPNSPGRTQPTKLGKELKLHLFMAIVGAWDIWDIPSILERYGCINEFDSEELYTVPLVEAERKLRSHVFQAYLQYCNHKHPLH